MKKSRRHFLKDLAATAAATAIIPAGNTFARAAKGLSQSDQPVVISTWRHGLAANEGAWKVLGNGGHALDAVEQGVRVTEGDLSNRSVGLGGNPDRDGAVTLDACIMDDKLRAGSVAFLQHIDHPVSVARHIMEHTPHVMLVGEGAYQYALENGFERSAVKVPVPEAMEAWHEWQKRAQYKPVINSENHDTIGMLALDAKGRLSGACTTSGMAYKIHGRVGDSPIIGAGLYVDNAVGAATATGVGELVIRTAGTHTVVELMRQGATPEEACREAVGRILKMDVDLSNMQVGYLALDKSGNYGACSVYKGFNYAVKNKAGANMIDAPNLR